MRILGVDPALGTTGWGVIDQQGSKLSFVVGGVVRTDPKMSMAERLKVIHEGFSEIIETYKPDVMAIEEVYVNNNARTSLKLGQARGVPIVVAAISGLDVFEYTPLQIKKATVGYGRAEKDQVQHMVKTLLPTATFATHDTADALAAAICHAHTCGMQQRYGT